MLRRLLGGRRTPPAPRRPMTRTPPRCPACGEALPVGGAAARVCPHCRAQLVMRTRRADNVRLLLTREQARDFDETRTDAEKRADAVARAANLGLSLDEFERQERELTQLRGRPPAPREVFWTLAENAIPAARRTGEWHRLSLIYWQQAQLLFDEGRPYLDARREASRAELRKYAAARAITHVRTIATGGCPSCRAISRQSFSVAEALRDLPVPNEECENGWCRCTWAVSLDTPVD